MKVKLSGYDSITKRKINFFVEPEIAERASQDENYKRELISKFSKEISHKLQSNKSNEGVYVPLTLSGTIETYTLQVSPVDYQRAVKDIGYATKLLQEYKESTSKRLNETVATNFVQQDETETVKESHSNILEIYDSTTSTTYHLTVSTSDYKRAHADLKFATKLLESHKKLCNLPVNENDINACNISNPENVEVCEISSQEANPNKKQKIDRAKWSDEETKCLLSLYKKHVEKYDAGNLTYDKFWRFITDGLKEEGHEYTLNQCVYKVDQLKRKYKSVMDNNAETGKAPITCQYFDELNEIFHKKPWIKPLSTAGSSVTLDIDDVDEKYYKSRSSKLCTTDLKKYFIEQSLDNQRLLDEEYKKEKLKILRDIANKS